MRLFKDPIDEVIVFAYGYMDEIKSMLSPLVERGGRLTSLLDLLRDNPDPAIPEEVCDAIA